MVYIDYDNFSKSKNPKSIISLFPADNKPGSYKNFFSSKQIGHLHIFWHQTTILGK